LRQFSPELAHLTPVGLRRNGVARLCPGRYPAAIRMGFLAFLALAQRQQAVLKYTLLLSPARS